MKHLKCNFPNICVAVSLAMLLEMEVKDISELFKDINPHERLDGQYRGITIQDVQMMMTEHSEKIRAGVPYVGPTFAGFIEYNFKFKTQNGFEVDNTNKVIGLMKGKPGLLTGVLSTGMGHCTAWDGERIFDQRLPEPIYLQDASDFFFASFCKLI